MSSIIRTAVALHAAVSEIDLASPKAGDFLASLAARYVKPEPVVVKAPSKLAAAKAKAKAEAESEPKAPPAVPFVNIPLPERGTVSAAEFLAGMLALGPVFVGGAHVDSTADEVVSQRNVTTFVARRDRAIQLIAGYCGYDRYAEFGLQEFSARKRALIESGCVEVIAFPTVCDRSAGVHVLATHKPTLIGYIAGLPNDERKDVLNLLSRERVCVETMCAILSPDGFVELNEDGTTHAYKDPCGNLTVDAHGAPCCCEAHMRLGLEQDRLTAIRKDLDVHRARCAG